jgi:hypothetical protein
MELCDYSTESVLVTSMPFVDVIQNLINLNACIRIKVRVGCAIVSQAHVIQLLEMTRMS